MDRIGALGMMAAVLFTAAATAAEPTKDKLVGAWKQVSAKFGGRDFKPEGATTLKLITPEQFMWVTYDKNGRVTRAAGGEYTLTGADYTEQPAYGTGNDFDIIRGSPQKFTCKLDGNKWHHNGKLSNGLTIEEIWEREEPRHAEAEKSPMIGTWTLISETFGGQECKREEGETCFYHVTPSHCMGAFVDKQGKMKDGGTSVCVIKGDTMTTYPTSALRGETKYLRNQHCTDTFKIEGDKCSSTGMHSDGIKTTSSYERVKRSGAVAQVAPLISAKPAANK